MIPKDTQFFASYHPDDESLVLPVLEQIKLAVLLQEIRGL